MTDLQQFASAPLYLKRCNLYFCTPGERTPQRILPHQYFLYIHSGQGIYNIDGIDYYTQPGQLYYCPSGVPNTIIASSVDPFVLSGLEVETPLPAEIFLRLFPRCFSIPDDPLTRQLLDELIRHCEHLMTISEETHALFRAFLLRVYTPHTPSANRNPDSRRILEYLYLHRLENVSLEELSSRFHYHPNQLNRQIHSLTNMTVHQLLIEYRLQYACDLLRNTSLTVSQIAHQCCYENANYFCHLFRKKRGCTPLEYRHAHST